MKLVQCLTIATSLAGLAAGRLQSPLGMVAASSSGPSMPGHIFNFTQTIDHFPNDPRYRPHAKGTYQQRYVVDTTYYKPGGPVILYLGGEGPIDGLAYGISWSASGVFCQEFNGLFVALEGRYYGASFPFNTSSTDNMAYATTEQTLADMNSFARNVRIPLKGISNITAPHTPWIISGGSLSGAQAAFAMKMYPNTFYAGMSTSGVIHGVEAYADWYAPIQKFAAQDCVASINNIVDNIDVLVDANNTAALQKLKEAFGLGSLTDIRDFAQTIAFPIGGPNNYTGSTWQEINWDPAIEAQIGGRDFFYFCRNFTQVNPPANNTAVDQEFAQYTDGQPWTNLGNWAAYIKRVILPYCASGDYNSADCYGTQHPQWWANTANNNYRSYLYGMCTEWGFYQAAQPRGTKSLISRVITTAYTQQWCNWSFPPGKYNAIPTNGPNLTRWNMYGDFDFSANRIMLIDGGADPWLDACYHATAAPPRYYTPEMPELLINGAGHCWDSYTDGPDFVNDPQFVQDAQFFELRVLTRWLQEFSSWKPGSN